MIQPSGRQAFPLERLQTGLPRSRSTDAVNDLQPASLQFLTNPGRCTKLLWIRSEGKARENRPRLRRSSVRQWAAAHPGRG